MGKTIAEKILGNFTLTPNENKFYDMLNGSDDTVDQRKPKTKIIEKVMAYIGKGLGFSFDYIL